MRRAAAADKNIAADFPVRNRIMGIEDMLDFLEVASQIQMHHN
jgi:hypothetical protein